MEREQIIKALECCSKTWHCGLCKYNGNCEEMKRSAIALIKELTEENEAWQKQLISQKEKAGKAYYDLACEVENLRTENERLNASCTKLTRMMQDNVRSENEELRKSNECDVRKLKADTVRKMQERLKKRLDRNGWDIAVDAQKIVDQIAKEMLEGV